MPLPGVTPFQCTAPILYQEADGTLVLSTVAEFDMSGGIVQTQVSVAVAYTLLVTDYIVGADTTGAAFNLTLPSAAVAAGRVFIIKDEGGNAGANNIGIAPEAAETIDGVNLGAGVAAATIAANYGYIAVYSDGTNWFTI